MPAMVALPRLVAQLAAGRRFETDHFSGANPKRAMQPKLCPACGSHMRTIFKSEIYECKECRVFATEPS
jgi:hypothetical protein